jgi:hypothetical protein
MAIWFSLVGWAYSPTVVLAVKQPVELANLLPWTANGEQARLLTVATGRVSYVQSK